MLCLSGRTLRPSAHHGTSLVGGRFLAMTTQTTRHRDRRSTPQHFDQRDRLILALYAQLKAERETRAALEEALANGVLSSEVLQAIISDPIPAITSEDIAGIEQALAQDAVRASGTKPLNGER